jgi:hypothetical protein
MDRLGISMSACAICGATSNLTACEADGYICEACSTRVREGKDTTTKKAKLMQRALIAKSSIALTVAAGGTVSDTDSFATEALALMALDDTGSTFTADAAIERTELLSALGTDCVAMGTDVAHSLKAKNSAELMLSHQLAVLHKISMSFASKAVLHANADTGVKLLNVSIRASESFRAGLLAFKKLRSDGGQQIVVRHVTVQPGGMAAIGHIEQKGGL